VRVRECECERVRVVCESECERECPWFVENTTGEKQSFGMYHVQHGAISTKTTTKRTQKNAEIAPFGKNYD